MQKNSLGLLIAIMTLSSCSKSSGPRILISEWEKKIVPKSALVRKVAASGALKTQCLKDVFSVEMLEEEVKEIEQNYAEGERIKGYWRHIDLSTLPIPQANFLKSFGDKLGDLADPNRFQNSTCPDVPCLINSLYGKENHIAGYVHYLWYLRFGLLLAADNLVPNQLSEKPGIFDGKAVPFKDYLFNNDELFGLWRISHMLREPFTSLANLKEIQRVPRGFKHERAEHKSACGLAAGLGWITLTDECLNINDPYFGPLYRGVIHEIAHHVDFEGGQKIGKSHRSLEPDYLKFTGMTLVEYVNEKQQKIRTWKMDTNATLVSIYAHTSPQEYFAENLAYFRIRGDQTFKTLTPEHYKFISDNYFGNQSYKDIDIIQSMFTKHNGNTFKAVFEALTECKKQKNSSRSKYFSKEDFSSSLSSQMLNCVGANASLYADELRAKIAINEPEGCSVLTGRYSKLEWDKVVKEHLRLKFNEQLQEIQRNYNYASIVETFYKEINDKKLARNAFVNCYDQDQKCFESELHKIALQKVEQMGISAEISPQLAQLYTSLYNYGDTKNESLQLYDTFIKSQSELIESETENLWQTCRDTSQDDEVAPVPGDFNPANGYLISSFSNCINSGFTQSLMGILRQIKVGQFSLEHPNEELILTPKIKSEMLKILSASYLNDRIEEAERAMVFLNEDNGEIHRKVISDFSWVEDVSDDKKILDDCKKHVYKILGNEWLFHQKKDLFSYFAQEKICSKISDSLDFKNWLESSRDEHIEKYLIDLDQKVLQRAHATASECVKKYPVNSVVYKLLYRSSREGCFKDGWKIFEEELLVESISGPLATKLRITSELIKGRFELRRGELQAGIMKERFN